MSPAAERPPLPREVRVLVAVAFFVALGFGIVAPALPVFARDGSVLRLGPAPKRELADALVQLIAERLA